MLTLGSIRGMSEVKSDEVAKVTMAFVPHAPHIRVRNLLRRLSKETVTRVEFFCNHSDRRSLRTLAMLVDYHAGSKTELWRAEREIDILLVLLSNGLYDGGIQAWREMENFVYLLEENALISRDSFCITDAPTESLVLGAYLHRLVTKGGYPDPSHAVWLGDNLDRITHLLNILKERGDTSSDLIRGLWSSEAQALASGAL